MLKKDMVGLRDEIDKLTDDINQANYNNKKLTQETDEKIQELNEEKNGLIETNKGLKGMILNF